MSSDIYQIYTAVRAVFPVAVGFRLLSRELAENTSPPIVVWEPKSHAFSSPEQKGPFYGVAGYPHPLLTKTLSMDLHCWGETDEHAEHLEAMLITSLHEVLQRNVEFTGSQWATPQWAQFGHVLTMSIDVRATLLEAAMVWPPLSSAYTTVTVTTITPDQTGAADPDGILQVQE